MDSSLPSDKTDNAGLDIKMKQAVISSENDRNQRDGCAALQIVRSSVRD